MIPVAIITRITYHCRLFFTMVTKRNIPMDLCRAKRAVYFVLCVSVCVSVCVCKPGLTV